MTKEVKNVIILGARQISADIADWASEIEGIKIVGFAENEDPYRCNEKFEGMPIHWVEDLPQLAADHFAVCGLSTTHRRRFAIQAERHGMRFVSLCHPSATVSTSSRLGIGCLISRGVVVAAHVSLGNHVFFNRSTSIGHHSSVGDFSTIQPGATIAGACEIGDSVYIGAGATIIDSVSIGEKAFITAGSLIRKNVPSGVQMSGNPARVVRRNLDGR